MKTRAHRKVPDRLVRTLAAHNPLQHPPLRWWHGLMLALAVLLGWLVNVAPVLMADLSSLVVADWKSSVLLRSTIILLSVYALVFVRSYHPLIGLALSLAALGGAARVGVVQTTEEPLTLGAALVLGALLLIPIRVIIRPNDSDLIAQLSERAERAERELQVCQRGETEATLRAEQAELALKLRGPA